MNKTLIVFTFSCLAFVLYAGLVFKTYKELELVRLQTQAMNNSCRVVNYCEVR